MKKSRVSEIAIVVVVCLTPWLAAQSQSTASAPTYFSPSAVGAEQSKGQASQLILWSQAERPQPAPIPFARTKPTGRPRLPDSSQSQKRVVLGTIERRGGVYILRVSNSQSPQFAAEIQLDDQQNASRFEGRLVKLTGSFDHESSSVQIDSIELIS